jgi:hypothetical protein
MKNNFINNNGVNLLNISTNKKTLVERFILLSCCLSKQHRSYKYLSVVADNNQATEMRSIPGGQIS